jgi:hypothetical protein
MFSYVSDALLDFYAYILACFMIRPMFAEKTEPQHHSDFIEYQYFQIALAIFSSVVYYDSSIKFALSSFFNKKKNSSPTASFFVSFRRASITTKLAPYSPPSASLKPCERECQVSK